MSTKPNIGHLDTAAGVASLIKVVQALRHRTLPPLANHTRAQPAARPRAHAVRDLDEASPWPGDRPRRAGVSSLGVGGTNAHVIVQEAPARPPTPPAAPEQMLALSGRSADVVDDAANRLADFLEAHPDTNLADVSHTLATGRRAMSHRRVVAATDVDVGCRHPPVERPQPGRRRRSARTSRHAWLSCSRAAARSTTAWRPASTSGSSVFHETMADGIARVRQRSGIDLGPLLARDAADDALRQTTASLPAIFLTSVALARQWMAWGVSPTAFVGHSLGEYTSAHLAGVLTLDGALDLIVARAKLIDRVSGTGAAMLAVPLAEADVRALLAPTLSLATINADDECVVAGSGRRHHVPAGIAARRRRHGHADPDRGRRPQLGARPDPA